MPERKITAMVTGASAGLGAEFCRQLAGRCDRIIAVARRRDRLEALAAELGDRAELVPVEADLRSVEGVARSLEILRQRGPVDYLVNNAGSGAFGNFADQSIDGQRDMISLHADAAITLCRAAIPFMRELGGGHIINVSALGAMIPRAGVAVYGATKAFLCYFSLALQDELAGSGIGVQALCPGYTSTEFHRDIRPEDLDLGRLAGASWSDPGEVVAASLAALGTGRVLVVAGEGNLALARRGLEKQLALLQ